MRLLKAILISYVCLGCGKTGGSAITTGQGNGSNGGGNIGGSGPVTSDVAYWLTKGDQSVLLQKQNDALNFSSSGSGTSTITVDPTQTFQTVDGFGFCLTDGSASLIN